ncbi:response regulator transcription factor [Paludibacterium paludis]|uniref:Response regulator n=1 Tax=Paludibacterium paludis TaxID=1225769 RepID=A0A918NZ95_9NEIS|nr:response regulator [Paludibacterium paludis]GGY06512.1 response regulator [Paludibacterium paludis]
MLELPHLIVALVEPSGVQANIIRQSLAELGIDQILQCSSGSDLLDALARGPADVVISAFYLDDMTGTDLVLRLRASDDTAELPFILVSSETNPDYIDPVRQAGTMAILPKPFSTRQMEKALRNTLDFLNAEDDQETDIDFAELAVLIVDDSLTARRHIRTVLERIGFERITEAYNGRDAITHLENTLFDLVVTDYNMPQMDGRALTEFIRSQSMQSSVPILMVSSEADSNKLAAVQDAGVSAICNKPFETDVVRNLVKQFIRSH